MDMDLGNQGRHQVLIVDDDDVMREKLQRILRVGNYQLSEAASGEETLALLAQHSYDCILLDNRLGDAEGVTLVHEIKVLLKRPCPVILITNSGDERLIIEAMRNGIYDYLNKKDISYEQLTSVMNAGLRWAELEMKLKESQEKLKYLSLYDGLTGLPNRNLFFDRLEQARLFSLREDTRFALLMMDLNMFKEVNDTLGHATGDELLKMVGQRLQGVSRSTDSVARLGGDEFAAILTNVESIEAAQIVANKIIDAISATFMIGNQVISIGISIGISFSSQTDVDAQSLLAKADSAMYKAKIGSRGYEFYLEDGIQKPQSAATLAGYLGPALKNKEFTLVFQPIIHLADGHCCGVEALARWKSPTLGQVSPAEFIRAAERSSIIIEMSYYLFDAALAQVKKWLNLGLEMPVSVNMSAKMLDTSDLASHISALLEKHQVPARLLVIEITETALMTNPNSATEMIESLYKMGIHISIDDFGTGFTSFKYLRQFGFNELKVDQLFVTDLKENTRDAYIVKSFVLLSQGFNVTLTAEGIEDEQRLVLLKKLGCTRAQGYFISKPMVGEALQDWLKTWRVNAKKLFGKVAPHQRKLEAFAK